MSTKKLTGKVQLNVVMRVAQLMVLWAIWGEIKDFMEAHLPVVRGLRWAISLGDPNDPGDITISNLRLFATALGENEMELKWRDDNDTLLMLKDLLNQLAVPIYQFDVLAWSLEPEPDKPDIRLGEQYFDDYPHPQPDVDEDAVNELMEQGFLHKSVKDHAADTQ